MFKFDMYETIKKHNEEYQKLHDLMIERNIYEEDFGPLTKEQIEEHKEKDAVLKNLSKKSTQERFIIYLIKLNLHLYISTQSLILPKAI
jgi:hypothetical protein